MVSDFQGNKRLANPEPIHSVLVYTVVLVSLLGLTACGNSDQASDTDGDRDPNALVRTLTTGEDDSVKNSSLRTGIETMEDLHDLSHFKSAFARSAAVHQLLLDSTWKEMVGLLEQSKEISRENIRDDVQILIVQRMAELNPKKTLRQIENLLAQSHLRLTSTVFGEWSVSNLDEAIARARDLDDSHKRAALQGILTSRDDLSNDLQRQIARQLGNELFFDSQNNPAVASTSTDNPIKAWNTLINDDQEDIAQLDTYLGIARALIDKEGIRALDQIYEAPMEKGMRDTIVRSVVCNVALRDPQATFQGAKFLSSDAQEIVLSAIVNVWAEMDPMNAFDAISNIRKTSLRTGLYETLIDAWATNDSQDVFDSLELLPERLRPMAEELARLAVARSAPADAVQFLANLTDARKIRSLATTIASSWAGLDVYEALDWATSSQLDDERTRHDVLSIVLRRLVDTDPELALRTALNQPLLKTGRKSYKGLEAVVIGEVARVDTKKATSMLSQVRDGTTKTDAYKAVGRELILNSEYTGALELSRRLPEKERRSYLSSVLSLWGREEPMAMFNSIDGIADPKIQSRVASTLLVQNHMSAKIFDENQVEHLTNYLGDGAHVIHGDSGIVIFQTDETRALSEMSFELLKERLK